MKQTHLNVSHCFRFTDTLSLACSSSAGINVFFWRELWCHLLAQQWQKETRNRSHFHSSVFSKLVCICNTFRWKLDDSQHYEMSSVSELIEEGRRFPRLSSGLWKLSIWRHHCDMRLYIVFSCCDVIFWPHQTVLLYPLSQYIHIMLIFPPTPSMYSVLFQEIENILTRVLYHNIAWSYHNIILSSFLSRHCLRGFDIKWSKVQEMTCSQKYSTADAISDSYWWFSEIPQWRIPFVLLFSYSFQYSGRTPTPASSLTCSATLPWNQFHVGLQCVCVCETVCVLQQRS